MTAVPAPGPDEPPPPARGLTREERGRDVSEAQAEAEAQTSKVKQYLHAMSPRFVWSMAEGYPVVIKQFLQFCLIIIYPAWVFGSAGRCSDPPVVLCDRLPGVVASVLAGAGIPEEEPPRGIRSHAPEVRQEVVGLFNPSGGAQVSVTPEVVRPRQTVQATVTTDRPVDKVSSATLEWGYTNFYRYRWAGRADSAAVQMNDSWWMMGEVGTDAGSEKDTEDWVGVTKVELPFSSGEFTGSSSSFKVPSWAPGSSKMLARWSARLKIDRGGRDVDTRADFTVIVGMDNVEFDDEPPARTGGDGRTDIEIVLPSLVFRAGETITGHLILTPNVDMSDCEVSIHWGQRRISHPLVRTPAVGGGGSRGDTVKLGKGFPLCSGTPVSVPFAVPLPADAPPTGTAVHSTLVWFLEATLMYSKWTQGIEQVRRQIAVVNAP